MERHELFHFLKQESAYIQDEYELISGRSAEDPGTAGDAGEENWRSLLSHWLPSKYRVVTNAAKWVSLNYTVFRRARPQGARRFGPVIFLPIDVLLIK
jgi:hypothetical protein